MATIVLPQVLVFQEFTEVPASITDPLRGCVFAPHADLHRYSDADEKAEIALGEYDPEVDSVYDWPARAVGGVVDTDYVKLFIDDALLQYHHTDLSAAETIAPAAGYSNRITADTLAFQSNGTAYPRSADFLDRDVAAGDTVYVRGVVGAESSELWTYVKSFVAEVVAAVVGDAVPDTNNVADQSSSITFEQTAGTENNVAVTGNLTTYDGRPDGGVNDVYTVLVISGSTGGDATTAKCRLLSASGNDDVEEFSPAAFAAVAEVGARGLQLGFTTVASDELVAGQTFKVTVAQTFEAAIARSAGSYSGTADTTYIVEVTRGGTFGAADEADQPQISVSTTHGTDYSGPSLVSEDNELIPIGTKGVKVRFGGSGADSLSSLSESGGSEAVLDPVDGLRKGDKFYIPVTAATSGRISTLVLGHNLSDDLLTATDLELKLFLKRNIEVSLNKIEAPPEVHYETAETQITVKSGITAYETSWTDSDVEQPLDVVGGTLYVEYREWLPTLVGELLEISDVAEIDDIDGPLHQDNPLKWGVYYALLNANGTPVKYTAVPTPDDEDGWLESLELVVGRDDVYSLVPLTRNQTVLNAFAAHCDSQSSAENGRWRGMFASLLAEEEVAVVDDTASSDATSVLATLSDDPDATGTQYRLLRVTSGNADLLELGVQAGDVVRYLYQVDGFGEVSYTEFIIDSVINETEIRLVTGHTVPIAVAQKIEVWHNRSKTEIATAVAADAGAYGSRRVCAVWPDEISSGGEAMPGYFLCAALAGLASGVVPQQGLTNVEIVGFDDVSRTTKFLNATQLQILRDSGVWVVTQAKDGSVVTQHALTTDVTDTNTREEMRRRNADSMSYFFLNRVAQFIGKANVTPSALALIRIELISAIEYLKQNGFVERLGGQLIDGEILELRQHTLLRDRAVAVLELDAPYPLNNLELHLVL